MKKRKAGFIITMLLSCVLVLSGCGSDKTTGKDPGESTNAAGTDSFTVSFIDSDGTTVLSTKEVKAGELVSEYTPEKENQVFMGWFGTPSLAHEFDFTQPITADTEIFAGFLEVVEDTRTYAVVGSGKSPLLSASNWGKEIEDEHYLTKSEDENVYTITMDLCEGDEFQFAVDSSWNEQRGGGYMANTDIDGTDYFSVSGGLSDSTKKANIKCLITGNYTLTLTTHPGEDAYDKIEWTYNGDMLGEILETETDYYIKGAIVTGWEDKYDDMYKMTEEDGVYKLTIALEEGDEFLFTTIVTADGNSGVGTEYVRYSNITDETSLSYVDGTESYNIIPKQNGTYSFSYNPDTKELTVEFKAE